MERPRLDLSPVKVVSGALAAASAAVAGSSLGVAGTVVGAAVMSVVATVAGSLYEHTTHRAAASVRVREERRLAPDRTAARRPAWVAVTAGAALLFAAGLALVTASEIALHRPLSELGQGGGGGTTVQRLLRPADSAQAGGSEPSGGAPAGESGPSPSPKGTDARERSSGGAGTPSARVTPPAAREPAPAPTASPTASEVASDGRPAPSTPTGNLAP